MSQGTSQSTDPHLDYAEQLFRERHGPNAVPPSRQAAARQTPPATDREALRLILLMAPHFQGGNSKTGAEVAEYLGIDPPLTMTALGAVARKRGFDPAKLWPWSTTA